MMLMKKMTAVTLQALMTLTGNLRVEMIMMMMTMLMNCLQRHVAFCTVRKWQSLFDEFKLCVLVQYTYNYGTDWTIRLGQNMEPGSTDPLFNSLEVINIIKLNEDDII